MPTNYGIPQAFLEQGLYILSQWYWWAFFLLIAAMKYGPGLFQSFRLRKAGLPEIDRMSGLEFEKYLEQLFRRLGYQVERTSYTHDQGADLILTKDGVRTAVQAKRHSKAVSNKAVQEVKTAMAHYHCDRAMVVANQPFTNSARELAQSNHVELWGREELAKAILASTTPTTASDTSPKARTAPTPTPIAPTRIAAAAEPARQSTQPTCPKCGRQLVVKSGRRGRFLACPGFPQCRHTQDL